MNKLVITDAQKETLSKHLPQIQRYIEDDDLDSLLADLDDKITEVGFDDNYDLNKLGLKLQRIYDEIYYQN